MQSLILVVSLFALVVGAPRSSDVHLFDQQAAFDAAWTVFTAQYAKQYVNSAEELERKRIFSENLKTIEMHNYLYSNGLKSYKMGVNQFTDMTYAEFLNQKTGFRPGSPDDLKSGATYLPPALNFTLPNSVDWRQKGYVTPVKDQGSCGSCWAFSSTGSLEGQHFRKTQKLVSLSEQNLVDCSEEFGNQGCNGGWMAYAFQYIMQNGGIDTEECYPYKAMEGSCNYKEDCVGATVSGFVQVPQSEQKLTQAIASEGPISVAVFVGRSFQHYQSGVYDDPDCGSQPNHAVLAVGYGTDNGDDYYIVKNSWAETWGEQGYIRMSRNKNNQCSIASYAIYPTV